MIGFCGPLPFQVGGADVFTQDSPSRRPPTPPRHPRHTPRLMSGSAIRRLSTTASHLRRLHTMANEYQTRQVGAPNTLDYRVFLEKDGKVVSPFQ